MTKRIELKLKDKNGKTKTYVQTTITARKRLEFLDFDTAARKATYNMKQFYEEEVRLVAALFADKGVTEDLIWDGMNALTMDDELQKIINAVTGADSPNWNPVDPSVLETLETASTD